MSSKMLMYEAEAQHGHRHIDTDNNLRNSRCVGVVDVGQWHVPDT